MKLFLTAIIVLHCSVFVSLKETFPDIKRALGSINHCVARSLEDTPTQMHQKLTGVKRGSTFTEEDVLQQVQAMTGKSRRQIRSCLYKAAPTCPQYSCGDSDSYSSIDGTCNNMDNPDWGSANVAYLRDLPPVYADGKRNQMNVLSAYIDGSATYGLNAEQLAGLRNGTTAKLQTNVFQLDGIPNIDLPGDDSASACRDGTLACPCFHADYMEIVLGADVAAQYGLDEVDGYHSVYDSSVNAGIANHFATAAWRFGHSLGTSTQGQNEKTNNALLVSFPQAELYFRVAESYKNQGIDGFLRFLQSNKMGGADNALPEAVQNQLFKDIVTRTSLDLAAINTQRGRDHGMPSYNAWKEWCGQEPFPANHTQNMAEKIRTIYAYDEDIDLFVGGLSEETLPGGVVGPLFGCMIGRQMRRSKTGDRYYFQNPPDTSTTIGRFTEDQVRSIQGFTLARMVCENTDTRFVQKNVFKQVSAYNPEIHCGTASADSEIPDIDFTLWA